jgi:hypothetical protein
LAGAAGKLARPNKSAAVLVTVKGKSLRDGLRPPLTVTALAGFAILWVGAKKRDSRSNKETDQESKKNCGSKTA